MLDALTFVFADTKSVPMHTAPELKSSDDYAISGVLMPTSLSIAHTFCFHLRSSKPPKVAPSDVKLPLTSIEGEQRERATFA